MLLEVGKVMGAKLPESVTIRLWLNSTSVVRHLNKLLSRRKPQNTYPQDPDILLHIQWLWNQMPPGTKQEVLRVKAHQDDQLLLDNLPLNARLNVAADQLATQYGTDARSTTQRSRPNPLAFHATKVHLMVNGQRITGMYKEVMRFHIHGTRLRSFLQSSWQTWKSDAVWETVDMDGISRAFKQLPTTKRHNISKMLYGWMNMGHQRIKINTLAKSNCPHCHLENETQEHVITCLHGKAKAHRYNALNVLCSTITTTGGTSKTWDFLHNSIRQWANNGG